MNILFIGDIFASPGRGLVTKYVQEIITTEKIQLAIANAENSAGGFGITPLIAEELFSTGLDVLTSGNHVWDKKEIFDYLPREPRLLRPANYPAELPGNGFIVAKARNGVEVAVIDLQGRAHLPATDCPFHKADQILASIDANVQVRFVDFHAELTSEKEAMGWHLNGRVSAVIGTHTHVPTADERILSGGTAYQTDVGMTGPTEREPAPFVGRRTPASPAICCSRAAAISDGHAEPAGERQGRRGVARGDRYRGSDDRPSFGHPTVH